MQPILVINEFPNVFLEELPGLLPKRDVDFVSKVYLNISPISMAPHIIVQPSYSNKKYS